MKKITLFISALFLVFLNVSYAWALPNCVGPLNTSTWKNCFGTYVLNGDKYVGEWQNGIVHGQGTLTYADGDKYVGGFKDGLFFGQGTITFGLDSEWAGEKYVGEWKDSERHGQGTHTYANGSKWVGGWGNDKLNGYAISYNGDGSVSQEGIFKDDVFQYAQKKDTLDGQLLLLPTESLELDKDIQSWNKKLAKVVSGIKAESRYGEQLLETTRLWNNPESAYDAYDIQKHYDFVKFGSTISNCLTEKPFDECVEITPKCYQTSYTTLDMNRCDSAEVEVLELIEKFESAEFKSRNEGDVETINLFDEAYPLWTKSVDADCAWKFSHFREGTMRSAVILKCHRDHLHLRIGWLHDDNDR